jgi:hypothetical protein
MESPFFQDALQGSVHRALNRFPVGTRCVVETTDRHGRIMGYRFDDGLLLYVQYTTVEGYTWARPEQVRLSSTVRRGRS